jgi:hypothetical protein
VAVDGRLEVEVRGAREIIRALERMPRTAERETKDGAERLARQMANAIRAAGRSRGRQTAAAARTVRVFRSVWPKVVAGPEVRLMGTEFGAKARFGWYRKGRYWDSPKRQFPARTPGNAGWWFFPTYRAYEPRIRAAHREMANAIIRSMPR